MLETIINPTPPKQGIKSFLPKLLFILKLLVALALVFILSMFLSGIILGISPTFDIYNLLTFLFIGYFSAKFYQLSTKQNYIFFIATVIISLTIPTTSGLFALLLIPPILKLFKLI